MRTKVLAEGGKRPPTSLRIPIPPEVRSSILGDMKRDKQQLVTDSGSNPTSQLLLEGSQIQEIPQQLPRDVFSVEAITQRVQFLANGLQPNLVAEDKEEFEKLFNVKIKFFLNSRRSGIPISIAMVEGSRQVRDDICGKMHCAFNCFAIRFTHKSGSHQDDYIFPHCNLCHIWGHWAKQCPNSETPRCCYCAETGHSAQNCPSKSVKRCVNCNGQNSVFYNGCLEFKKHWACAQKRQSIVNTGASVVRKPAVSASPFVVPPPRAASFSKDTTLKNTDSNDSHCLPHRN
ncbi:hypothetical protein ACOME3_007543 [Neoechinorhynchus agilis]